MIISAPAPSPRGSGPLAVAAAVPSIAPGVEVWPVKTGSDADANKVNLTTGLVSSTVEELVSAQVSVTGTEAAVRISGRGNGIRLGPGAIVAAWSSAGPTLSEKSCGRRGFQ